MYVCVLYTKEFLGENLAVLNYQSMVFLISHLQNNCCLRWLPILIPYKLVISSLHWTKSDISCCRTQVGYAHDISCPQHISSQHDITFPATCHGGIEPNPLYIMDAGQMISSIWPQHDTKNFMLEYLCSMGA